MDANVEIKEVLDEIIDEMFYNKADYVKNPDRDFSRNRKLGFKELITFLLTMGGNTLNGVVYDFFEHNPYRIVSTSALIQQRNKLVDDIFEKLFHLFYDAVEDTQMYKGYKLFAVDGSDLNIVDDPEADTYVKPQKTKNGLLSTGYNQYHINAVYDILNRVYVDAVLCPKPTANERRDFIEMLDRIELKNPTIFIADRGYPSWNIYAHFKYKKNADFLIRVPNDQTSLIKDLPSANLDVTRKIVITFNTAYKNTPGYQFIQVKKNVMTNREYTGGTRFRDWDFGMFEELTLRIVRFKISENEYETIVTSLPKSKFSLDEIKKLYGMRWHIETSFRQLKYGVGLVNLHSKKDVFIKQEIFAKLTMYNFCERVLTRTEVPTIERKDERKCAYELDRTMGTQICFDFFREQVKSEHLTMLLTKYRQPVRPNRHDTRKKKSKPVVPFGYRVA